MFFRYLLSSLLTKTSERSWPWGNEKEIKLLLVNKMIVERMNEFPGGGTLLPPYGDKPKLQDQLSKTWARENFFFPICFLPISIHLSHLNCSHHVQHCVRSWECKWLVWAVKKLQSSKRKKFITQCNILNVSTEVCAASYRSSLEANTAFKIKCWMILYNKWSF